MGKLKRAQSQYKPGKFFFQFPHAVEDDPNYFNLTHKAKALLHAMSRLYNGFNNGDISIAWSDMKLRGWSSKGTLEDAKKELIEHDWIYLTRQGTKWGDCNLYAISFIEIDEVKPDLDVKFKRGYLRKAIKKC